MEITLVSESACIFGLFYTLSLPHLSTVGHILSNFREKHQQNGCDSALESLLVAKQLSLVNIYQLLKVVAVLPITSCEAERAFSKMKLLKTYLRSTMTNTR